MFAGFRHENSRQLSRYPLRPLHIRTVIIKQPRRTPPNYPVRVTLACCSASNLHVEKNKPLATLHLCRRPNHTIIATVHNQSPRRKSAPEISRKRTQIHWGRRGPLFAQGQDLVQFAGHIRRYKRKTWQIRGTSVLQRSPADHLMSTTSTTNVANVITCRTTCSVLGVIPLRAGRKACVLPNIA